jgi:hypothetical protein
MAMKRFLMAGLSAALALAAAFSAPAEAAGVKKGTRGVVEVEYEMTSQGSTKTADVQREWRGKRTLTIAFEVVAGDVQAKPVLLAGAPKGEKSFVAKTQATAKKHEKTLGTMEAAIKKCKGDQDCEMRVAMEFMGTDEGSAMMGDSMAIAREASGSGAEPRYQLWSPAGAGGKPRALSGTYAVDQYEKSQVYDPECHKTDNLCTTVSQIKGSGPLGAEALQTIAGQLGTAETPFCGVSLDTAERLFMLGIPQPVGVVVDVKEDVQSSQDGKSSGNSKLNWLQQVQQWEGLGVADLSYAEPLKELRGEIKKDLAKGYGPTMAIRWRFAVKP